MPKHIHRLEETRQHVNAAFDLALPAWWFAYGKISVIESADSFANFVVDQVLNEGYIFEEATSMTDLFDTWMEANK